MERTGKVITGAQIKKIYALARERGMDTDLLHAHMETLVRKDSVAKLTVSEGIRLIDSLEGKPGQPKGEEKASWKQLQFIFGLMKKLEWINPDGTPDTDRLDRFLQSPKAGINLGSYQWLTRTKASKLIEALKSMSAREESKPEKMVAD